MPIAVIAYDSTCSKRRRKLHHRLKQWGLYTQNSVFECELSFASATELFAQLNDLLNPEEDRLLLSWITPGANIQTMTNSSQTCVSSPLLYKDK